MDFLTKYYTQDLQSILGMNSQTTSYVLKQIHLEEIKQKAPMKWYIKPFICVINLFHFLSASTTWISCH